MGFLGSVGKVFSTAAKAVATGGVSLIAPKLIPSSVNRVLDTVTTLQNPSSLSQLQQTIGLAAMPASGGLSGMLMSQPTIGATPMAFNTSGFLGNVGNILGQTPFGGSTGGQLLGAGLQIGSALTARATPVANKPMSAPMTGAQLGTPTNVRGLTKEIFEAGVKILSRLGIPYRASVGSYTGALKRTLTSIAALAKRTPAGTIVSILMGLGLTAMEAYQVATWYQTKKRHRRMNPANSRALRRSVRRIKAFHRLCGDADVIKSRRRPMARIGSGCGTCGKRKCSC